MNARRKCRVCGAECVVGRGGGLLQHTRQVKAATEGALVFDLANGWHEVGGHPPEHEVCPGGTKGERP